MNHNILMIIIIACVTFLTRLLPFIAFSNQESPLIEYLGKVLPYAIMSMLVVYCLKDIDLFGKFHGISEIIAVVTVIVLHIYKRNTLLSILGGTIIYMICVQFIFI